MAVPTIAPLVAALALIVSVTSADFDRALLVGRQSEAERAAFHAAYVVPLNDATVERIEVLTEFRRAVMTVEARARFGDYLYGAQQLEAAMRPFHNRVTLRARLRFHPQNVLTSIPPYEIVVGAPGDRPVPLALTTRDPVFVQTAKDRTALMGATLETVFDSGILGQHPYPVAVLLDGRTIASTVIDFARLD